MYIEQVGFENQRKKKQKISSFVKSQFLALAEPAIFICDVAEWREVRHGGPSR